MSRINHWQSGTAAFMVMGIIASAVAPILTPAPAYAQRFSPDWSRQQQTTQVTIPSGVSIPVIYNQADKIVVTPTETVPVTLTVSANIKNRSGDILIPYGTQIAGQIQPAQGGSQFVAKELIFSDSRHQPLNADSQIITQTQQISPGADTSSILKGAVVGSGAAALISALAGNKKITALKVLAGTAAGAVGGLLLGHKTANVISINPKTDLTLTLHSDLVLAQQ